VFCGLLMKVCILLMFSEHDVFVLLIDMSQLLWCVLQRKECLEEKQIMQVVLV